MFYSHNLRYMHICTQKHIQHNKDERTQFFRKIYLSLYWKGCIWEGVGDWTELQHIDPYSYGQNSVSFPFSWTAQPGAWGTRSLLRSCSHSSNWNTDFKLWTPTALNFLSPGLYHCFTSTQFNLTTVKAIPWSNDILERISSFDSLAGSEVNMQQSFHNYYSKFHIWNFLHVRLYPLTHTFDRIIFQEIILKKTQKEITWTTAKQNLT